MPRPNPTRSTAARRSQDIRPSAILTACATVVALMLLWMGLAP